MQIIRIQATDSTNRLLKQRSEDAPSLPEGTTLVAWEQTAGRGQADNAWEAEAGKNLTFSMLLYPDFLLPKQHFLLSEAVALGVINAVMASLTHNSMKKVAHPEVCIKWPNDIYVGEQKIAGILIENDWQDGHIRRSIVGVGMNVNQLEFKSEAPNPVSIKQITGLDTDLDTLLEEILYHIYKVYEQLKDYCLGTYSDDCAGRPYIAQMYAQNLYRKTGFFDYEDENGRFRAAIQSISDDGLLHLETDKGERRTYAFKEVRTL
ncbi:biotin--[acetyl-CoA-carboxylase] ligase [Bacteroidia bacterium]|nr:biotin--[acetyl-CoA-carboxylase] ligase [Bacteroidia bacterium]